jgi:hypothetical protein
MSYIPLHPILLHTLFLVLDAEYGVCPLEYLANLDLCDKAQRLNYLEQYNKPFHASKSRDEMIVLKVNIEYFVSLLKSGANEDEILGEITWGLLLGPEPKGCLAEFLTDAMRVVCCDIGEVDAQVRTADNVMYIEHAACIWRGVTWPGLE